MTKKKTTNKKENTKLKKKNGFRSIFTVYWTSYLFSRCKHSSTLYLSYLFFFLSLLVFHFLCCCCCCYCLCCPPTGVHEHTIFEVHFHIIARMMIMNKHIVCCLVRFGLVWLSTSHSMPSHTMPYHTIPYHPHHVNVVAFQNCYDNRSFANSFYLTFHFFFFIGRSECLLLCVLVRN